MDYEPPPPPTPTQETRDVIAELFTYHPPTPEQVELYVQIRTAGESLARVIHVCCPGGPDRTAAIRKVREAVMTANASIATDNAAAQYR